MDTAQARFAIEEALRKNSEKELVVGIVFRHQPSLFAGPRVGSYFDRPEIVAASRLESESSESIADWEVPVIRCIAIPTIL